MKEVWKNVFGWEGVYQVSNLGNVKRIAFCSRGAGILKPSTSQKYLRVRLMYNKREETRSVHSLVLEAFVCPRPEGMEGNHKDGNKHNNTLDNLEWVTPSENTRHSFRFLKRNVPSGEDHGMSKLSSDTVSKIRKMYSSGNYSQRQLAKLFGVVQSTIRDALLFRTWRNG